MSVLTDIPAEGHDASHLELERVAAHKVVDSLERVAEELLSDMSRQRLTHPASVTGLKP
jgi:hypothetical protein